MAKQITLDQLETSLLQLLDNKMEQDFFGITSDSIDCLYFAENEGKINIEYEIIYREQKIYAEKLIEFFSEKGYETEITTYGNKPDYPESMEAPVYIFETNAEIEEVIALSNEIMKIIFHKNVHTKFDLVP